MTEVTRILSRITHGDPRAADELLPIIYNDLRALAHRRLAGDPAGRSLETTELVHEAYLRLVGSDQQWQGNAHFFSAAAEAMRRILVERARQKRQLKRGGQCNRELLHDGVPAPTPSPHEVLIVDDVLDQFAVEHPTEAETGQASLFCGV